VGIGENSSVSEASPGDWRTLFTVYWAKQNLVPFVRTEIMMFKTCSAIALLGASFSVVSCLAANARTTGNTYPPGKTLSAKSNGNPTPTIRWRVLERFPGVCLWMT